MSAAPPTPLQDQRYLLLAELGRGGMATVYRAFDRVRQRIVAIKVSLDPCAHGPAHPLAEEYDAWSRLRHPNVVRIYGLEVSSSGPLPPTVPYLVLEHVPGRPLHRVLPPGTADSTRLRDLAIEILRGLQHVHAAGLVHRDLKPANVLVGTGGDDCRLPVKLTDFGLAATTGSREPPGVLNGSLPYVAPECITGGVVDGRADLYGLGILLFHLATAAWPAPGRSPEQILRWHLEGPPADPRHLRPRFPDRLANFIRRLTARDPLRRPGDAGQALALLGASSGTERARVFPRGLRAERARLRLALDAVRLGAHRTERLPADRTGNGELLRELEVRARIHGVRYVSIEDERTLQRAVVGLLQQVPGEAGKLVAAFRLAESISVHLVAGLPVCGDRERPAGANGTRSGARKSAERVAKFLINLAERRPLVLRIGATNGCGELVAGVADRLEAGTGRERDAPAPRGGLLLLLTARETRERLTAASTLPLCPVAEPEVEDLLQ